MISWGRSFLRNESGATAIEYALIVALIAVAIIGSLGTVGNRLADTFNNIANNLGSDF